jgi:hypothetical protein
MDLFILDCVCMAGDLNLKNIPFGHVTSGFNPLSLRPQICFGRFS